MLQKKLTGREELLAHNFLFNTELTEFNHRDSQKYIKTLRISVHPLCSLWLPIKFLFNFAL